MKISTAYAIARHVGASAAITLGVLTAYYPGHVWMSAALTVLTALGFYAVPAQGQLLPARTVYSTTVLPPDKAPNP